MPMTAGEIVDRVLAEIGCGTIEGTIDTFKAGSPEADVAGVATTFLATYDVLARAAERGLNFVITHEPTFYHHREETDAIEGDAVLAAKRELIERTGVVIWRCHDYWHRRRPDGIDAGLFEAMGWAGRQADDDPKVLALPEAPVGELAAALKAKLSARAVRVVGDAEMATGKVGLCLGAVSAARQIRKLQRPDVEVLVVGEAREWETVEYVRDAAAQGRRKAMIVLGHCASEEAGMAYFARWLAGLIPSLPVEFVPAGDPFLAV